MTRNSLSDLVATYLDDLRANRSASHCHRTAGILSRLARDLGNPTLAALAPAAVLTYRARRREAGASKRTANKEVGALQAALRWGVRAGLLERNPLEGLPRLSVRPGDMVRVPRALDAGELARLLETAEVLDRLQAGDPPGSRTIPQAPTWRLFAGTGARRGELVALRWGSIDESGSAVLLRAETTKSGHERRVPIAPPLVDQLRELRHAQARMLRRLPAQSDLVLLTPRGVPWARHVGNLGRTLRALLRAAGVPRIDGNGRRFSVHGFRHTFGTLLARNGVHAKVAQQLLGHADESLTLRFYTHLGEGERRAAVEALHGAVEGKGWSQMRDSNPRPPLYECGPRLPNPRESASTPNDSSRFGRPEHPAGSERAPETRPHHATRASVAAAGGMTRQGLESEALPAGGREASRAPIDPRPVPSFHPTAGAVTRRAELSIHEDAEPPRGPAVGPLRRRRAR